MMSSMGVEPARLGNTIRYFESQLGPDEPCPEARERL